MATRTIHRLNYQLLVDSSQFEKGMVASRSELNMAKREMRAMLTPAEKMEVSLAKLGKLAQKDAKFQELYNRKLQEYKRFTEQAVQAEKQRTRSAGDLRRQLVAAAGAYISFQTAISAGRGISRQIDEMDRLAKTATNLGTSTEFLSGLGFVAGKVSGFDADQTSKAIEKMTRRIAQAAQGTGEAKAVLDQLGLSAQRLTQMGPEKTFFAIARAMRDIKNDGERSAIAMKLFDDEQAGIHSTMKLSNDEFAKQIKLAKELGVVLSETDAKRAEAAKDQLEEFRAELNNLKKEAALASTPVIGAAAGGMRAFRELQKEGEPAWLAPLTMIFEGSNNAAIRRGFTGERGGGYIGLDEAEVDRRLAAIQRNADGTLSDSRLSAATAKQIAKELDQRKIAQSFRAGIMGGLKDGGRNITDGINSLMRTAASQAESVQGFLASVQVRPNEREDQIRQEIAQTVNPVESIAAGSAQAFDIINRASASATVETQMAQIQTDNSVRQTNLLEQILSFMQDDKFSSKEYEEA